MFNTKNFEQKSTTAFENEVCKIRYMEVPCDARRAFQSAWDARDDFSEHGENTIANAKEMFAELFGLSGPVSGPEVTSPVGINFGAPPGSIQFLEIDPDARDHHIAIYYVFPKDPDPENLQNNNDEHGGRLYMLSNGRDFQLAAADIREIINMFPIICKGY